MKQAVTQKGILGNKGAQKFTNINKDCFLDSKLRQIERRMKEAVRFNATTERLPG